MLFAVYDLRLLVLVFLSEKSLLINRVVKISNKAAEFNLDVSWLGSKNI